MAGKDKTKKVQFEFLAPNARKVYLAGDFNHWNSGANPMKKDKKGIWKTIVSLKPGRYEYRFLKDGNWENDPACCDCVPNEFGSQNCVRIVE
ncbi:MAG TPA: isoamylase early set domain-containing protein [Thermodesulfobacteriota bacterium]|jgi:1,4-alpha-glucan branching enzyme|nr:isoamylase early set domain-containing protein [Thermodesulfobacteriota bacterium]